MPRYGPPGPAHLPKAGQVRAFSRSIPTREIRDTPQGRPRANPNRPNAAGEDAIRAAEVDLAPGVQRAGPDQGEEHYIFVYDDDSREPLIDAFRDQAADPEPEP